MAGWDDLGRVLGGGVNTEAAYQRGQTRAAQLEGLIAQARIKKSEADARANLPGALTKLDAPADLATLFAAGIDPRQLSGYTGDVQEQGFRGDAASRALAGDWDSANAALMGLANGPQQLGTIEGQNLLANRFLSGGGGITTTDQGRAGMAADAARARASDASAASSYASADATRQRLGIAQQQFALQRAGQWNPGGASESTGAGGAGGGLKLTEGQSKDLVYLRRGSEANKLLETLANNMTAGHGQQGAMRGAADVFLRGLPGVGDSTAVNSLVSSERQQAEQAAKEFLSAVLRKDTGAAITSQEIDIYGHTYLPQPGDSPQVLQQKARAREIALEAIATGLGPERAAMAAPTAGAVFWGQSPAPAGPASAGARRRYNPATGRIE